MTDLPAEDVRTYPRPPALEPVSQRITVVLGGVEIVSTTDALRILETHHAPTYYIPRDAVRATFSRAAGESYCEWKGAARYWSLAAGNRLAERSTWDYPNPVARYAALAGHVAIYAHAMDECRVGGEIVRPQPGSFYGGWTTDNLLGTIKGAPGTEGW